MSFRFKVFNYTKTFQMVGPKTFTLIQFVTKWRIMPLQNDIQNNSSEFNSFVHKMSHVQKEMICIRRGMYLFATTFYMTLRFLILPSFLFTRNLRIDKNYTLSIFMLSGFRQLYSNFQFNTTCIYHKTMSFISNYTHAYSLSHAFTLQIIDLNMLLIYLNQIMRFKHILTKMYLVYKSHLHSSKFVISLYLYNSHS